MICVLVVSKAKVEGGRGIRLWICFGFLLYCFVMIS